MHVRQYAEEVDPVQQLGVDVVRKKHSLATLGDPLRYRANDRIKFEVKP
jgi:hypothetical protein